MKRALLWLSVLALLALGIFFARGGLSPLLADWTGEEDTEYQIKALGHLALSVAQPPRSTADFAPMKYADLNPFGVNTDLDQEVEEPKLRQAVQMIHAAGFHWIRQEFPWEQIEQPGKGQFWDYKYNHSTWDKYDRIVALAQEYGLEIVARLDVPPAWSRHDGRERGDHAPPDNYDDYGDFVAAVASRYKGKIRFYQLWNEPNIYPEWGEQPVNAGEFVRLLKIGYARVKAADPNAVVICASLAQTVETGPENLSELTFLQQMYTAGARGSFDILAVNDYGIWTGPGDRRVDEDRINFSRPTLVREIMVKNGDADKPIWAMEVGWNALPPNMEPTFGVVTLQQQARYTVQAYTRAQNEMPWMGPLMYWFFKRATDTEMNQPFYYFRMLEHNFVPLPVYGAMRDYIPQARIVTPGFRSTSHWAMDWQGGWETRQDQQAYFGEYKLGHSGDSVRFVFSGTDLDLVVLQNPYGGAMRVQVDDAPPREVELWRTDSGAGGRIPLDRDLEDGQHRVALTVTHAPVAINGWIVQRGYGWWASRIGVLGLLGCLVAGIWFGRGWTRKTRIKP